MNCQSDQFKFVDGFALSPNGTKFGKKYKRGIFNAGSTSIENFLVKNINYTRLKNYSPKTVRALQLVSANEGKFEAINTWDSAFLSFGIFQWTTGTSDNPGELPALLDRLKKFNGDVFHRFFGQFDLDVELVESPTGEPQRGFFTLDNLLLDRSERKEKLRTLEWAYRFWLSGHDDFARQIQLEWAFDRVNLFYRHSEKKVNGRFIADYIRSELGLALLLDEHVNRPDNVPATLKKAISFLGDEANNEKQLIEVYLQFRDKTDMTNSIGRAKEIFNVN